MAANILNFYALLEQALARGQDVFDVIIDDWGTSAADRYPLVGQAGIPTSIAGIVIGPRSTVDRAWVTWNTGTTIPTGLVDPEQSSHRLSVDTPLLFTQQAGTGTLANGGSPATAQRAGQLYVFPSLTVPAGQGVVESTLLPATYSKTDGTVVPFAGIPGPVLHLQLLLRAGYVPPPTKRAPYVYLEADLAGFSTPGVEETIIQIPTFGRKDVYIQVSCTDAGVVYRLGALRGVNTQIRIQETTEGQKTAAAADQSIGFHLCSPRADYVTLYGTSPGTGTISYGVVAYD